MGAWAVPSPRIASPRSVPSLPPAVAHPQDFGHGRLALHHWQPGGQGAASLWVDQGLPQACSRQCKCGVLLCRVRAVGAALPGSGLPCTCMPHALSCGFRAVHLHPACAGVPRGQRRADRPSRPLPERAQGMELRAGGAGALVYHWLVYQLAVVTSGRGIYAVPTPACGSCKAASPAT